MSAPLCTLPLTGNSLLLKTDSCLLAPDPGSPPGTPLVSPSHQVGVSLGVTPCRAGPSRCAPNLVHFSLRSLQACPSQLSPAVLQSPHDTALTLPCIPATPAPTRRPCLNARARFHVGKPSPRSEGQAVCREPRPPETYPGLPVPAQSLGVPPDGFLEDSASS